MHAEKLRTITLALTFGLIAVVAGWQFATGVTLQRLLFAVVLTIPLWLPLRGFLKRTRRTYAWATLCVIPYFVLALTEAVANPAQRGWSGACLLLAFALFITLILYLRASAPRMQTGE